MSPFRASAAITEDWKNFDFALDDGVATVTFSRPDKLNALTFDVYADLRDLLAELPHRGDVRVLVLTGEGRGFCPAGTSRRSSASCRMEAAQLLEFTRMSGAVVKAMRDAPIPIIAAVNGVAAGAGAVLALAADFRLAGEAAKFSFLFTRVGLAGADMGAAYLLPRLVGLGRATELLILGGEVDADHAAEIGLGTRVDDLAAATRSWPGGWPTVLAWRTRRRKCSSLASSTSTWAARSRWRHSPRRADEGRGLPRVLRALVGGADVIVNRPASRSRPATRTPSSQEA